MRPQIIAKMSLTALLFLAAIYPVYGQSAADETAIRDNVKQLETGWNTKSGAAFAKPFADDADYVIINGRVLKGKEAIATGHQRIFDTVYKDTTLALAVKQLRFIRPDVAVVHVSARRDGPGKEINHAMITLVMAKGQQGWTIDAFQNTAVASQ
ncbi:MAG TPA: SgcJ/EcaC family oxidoreductase [Pyrinomonadaceae bacterium]|nr:SgcJ/EcaC family oxidoreductase [Pyrinomonadaceae bacterium]